MTKKHHDSRDLLAQNLETLLKLTEPTLRMPEPVRARIRARLAEMEREISPTASSLEHRWTWLLTSIGPRWALAAAAVLTAILVSLWLGDSRGGITWADVLIRLEDVRTVVANTETKVSSAAGTQVRHRARVYFKDSGLSRTELFSPHPPASSTASEAESIVIIRREPEKTVQLMLYPDRKHAERVNHIFRFPGGGVRPKPIIDLVSESWRRLARIASADTTKIGEREIDGLPAVGFEAPAEELMGEPEPGISEGRILVWADRDTAVPLLLEFEFLDPEGSFIQTTISQIEWDAPLSDELFGVSIPEGWDLRETRREVAEYPNTSLAPHVTLHIGPQGGDPIVTELDVVRIKRGEHISHLSHDIPDSIRITLQLTSCASANLRSFANEHPLEVLLASFNEETLVVPDLRDEDGTLVGIDLSRLGKTLTELEDAYFIEHQQSVVER